MAAICWYHVGPTDCTRSATDTWDLCSQNYSSTKLPDALPLDAVKTLDDALYQRKRDASRAAHVELVARTSRCGGTAHAKLTERESAWPTVQAWRPAHQRERGIGIRNFRRTAS